jgi:chromosome segregation ATPase|tara:strand:+ start:54 stop:473 length:420 start_codon:yes stop_codon:yes gene_type:complete
MVKVNKTISLDIDLAEELKDIGNGSKLINDLLKEHLRGDHLKDIEQIELKILEVKREIEDLMTEENNLRKKLQNAKQKETELKERFQDVPLEILEDFKFYPKMTEDIFIKRWNMHYSKKYDIILEDALNAYRSYYEKTE